MNKALRSGTIAVSAAAAVLALAACEKPKSDAAPAAAPSVSVTVSVSADPAEAAPSTSASGRTRNGQGTGSTRPSTGASNASGSAKIVFFDITRHPQCKAPGVSRSPAQISWKVTGATGIALSVDTDKVGHYGEYGPEGKLDFPFTCGGTELTETHTFRITTRGGRGAPATSPVVQTTASVPQYSQG